MTSAKSDEGRWGMPEGGNIDDFIAQAAADELADRMAQQKKASPIEYAKTRDGISAQLVYYHIRVGHLKKETCVCGRSVIDIELADALFFPPGKHDVDEEESE
jgi:hypothetical protein